MKNTDTTTTASAQPENVRGTIAREFIQCRADNGELGDFLATNANRRVSPVFQDLPSLYTWASANGWKAQAGAYIYKS